MQTHPESPFLELRSRICVLRLLSCFLLLCLLPLPTVAASIAGNAEEERSAVLSGPDASTETRSAWTKTNVAQSNAGMTSVGESASVTIPLAADLPGGSYAGSITIESLNAGARSIQLTGEAVTGHLTYLPMIILEVAPPPPVCEELVANGDAEADAGWVFPLTAYQASYSSTRAHNGERSLVAGVVTQPDVYSYSSFYQEVTAPAGTGQARLEFWWYPISDEAPAATASSIEPAPEWLQQLVDETLPVDVLIGDWQYVLLLDETNTIVDQLMWTRSAAAEWQKVELDVPAYTPGRQLKLWFGVYNDGDGRSTAMHVDDISLTWCLE